MEGENVIITAPSNTALRIILVVIFSVGVIGHALPFTLPIMKLLTPLTLFLFGGLILFNTISDLNRPLIYWLSITFIATFILEVVGVHTGMVFGAYEYGDVLGRKLLDVPIIIGFNWTIIILGAIGIVQDAFPEKPLLAAFMVAVLALGFDVFLEPVAMQLDYWMWSGGVIPLQNYTAWFTIAFVSAFAFFHFEIKFNKALVSFYFFVQFIFFILLNAFLG